MKFLCFSLVLLIGCACSCKSKVDRDLASCRSHALLLAGVIAYKERHGNYPPRLVDLLEEIEVEMKMIAPHRDNSVLLAVQYGSPMA